jgi:hypothetical protein
MGFTGAVVSDYENALVVHDIFKLELRQDNAYEGIRHTVGHDVSSDKPFRILLFVGIGKLYDAFHRIKTHQVFVLHSYPPFLRLVLLKMIPGKKAAFRWRMPAPALSAF